MCFNTTKQEHGAWVGKESISLTHRRQSAKEIVGNAHLLVTDDRASLKMTLWRKGRGFYFQNKPSFTHTLIPTYSQSEKSVCPSSRHQDVCVQGLLRIPHSDTSLWSSSCLLPWLVTSHCLGMRFLNPGADSNCHLLSLHSTPPL